MLACPNASSKHTCGSCHTSLPCSRVIWNKLHQHLVCLGQHTVAGQQCHTFARFCKVHLHGIAVDRIAQEQQVHAELHRLLEPRLVLVLRHLAVPVEHIAPDPGIHCPERQRALGHGRFLAAKLHEPAVIRAIVPREPSPIALQSATIPLCGMRLAFDTSRIIQYTIWPKFLTLTLLFANVLWKLCISSCKRPRPVLTQRHARRSMAVADPVDPVAVRLLEIVLTVKHAEGDERSG